MRWLPRVALSLGTLLLVVGLPEIGLRLLSRGPALAAEEMAADPDTAWALSPGATMAMRRPTSINRLGLQGPEPGPGRRVLVTGDSSVFAVGIEGNPSFSQVLGERLGPSVEVHNGGVPGYSSSQSLAQARKIWPELQPELLIVGNLWSDNNFDSFVDAELLAEAGRPGRRLAHSLARLSQRSALLMALLRWRGADRQEIVGWGRVGQETIRGQRRVPLATYRDNLLELSTLALNSGGHVLFLMLSNSEDLDHPDRPWAWDPYRQTMRDVAAQLGCPLVESPPAFRRAAAQGQGLFVDDMHPSGGGHRLLGELLAEELRQRGWEQGRALCSGGGPAAEVPPDPWTWEEGAAPPQRTPTVAGLILGNPGKRGDLEVQLLDEGGAVLDRVGLPAAAPYALLADPPPTRGRVRVLEARQGRVLVEQELDLAAGTAWGVHLPLPEPGR